MLSSFIGSGLLVLSFAGVSTAAPPQGEEHALADQVRQHPRDFRANSRLGELYAHRGEYRAAVRYLRCAYELNPADYSNAFDLAQAELQAGEALAARSLIRSLLERDDRPELHNLLADCEETLGNFREAANQYQIAARADPSEQNLFSFGSELLKYGAYREAVQVFSYAAQHYPQSPRIRVALGIAQYSVGDYRNAVATLCSAVDVNPKDTRAFEFLGKMIGVAPELSHEVSARLKHFAAIYPNNPSANYYYAMSLRAEPDGSHDAPRPFFERAVGQAPGFAEAHYQLGIVCDEQGDIKCAVSEIETAVRLKPDWKSAHYRLAQLYRKTGQTALSEREYKAVRNARER